MATRAAYSEFMRVLSDPEGMARRQSYAPIVARYERRWARYTNGIFEDRVFWNRYISGNGLYRFTRSIFNPARNLGDFYSSVIYPGVLAIDAKRLPDGTQLAIPLADDIDPELRNAIGQLWQWSNWQDGMAVMTLFGSVLGDVGVEVVDDLERGKVTFDVIWPGLVTDLDLDSTGNVKAHAIEYDYEDSDDGKIYTFRREVDGERIAEFRDGELYRYDPDVAAERANPYGFDPFVWCRHTNIGSVYGAPALRNEQAADEYNSLASHTYDHAHGILSAPVLVGGANSGTLGTAATSQVKRPSAQDSTPADERAREGIRFITAGPDAVVATIQLPEGEVDKHLARLLAGIEREHPELTMYEQLRGMSQVTGPGAEVLIGDTGNLVNRARAGYDTQTIKLHQMAVAIAGFRANNGDWGSNLSRQQQAFKPFSLDSYEAGDLDFEIGIRPLMPVPQDPMQDGGQTKQMIAAAQKLLEDNQ